ncbi:MAG: hypothetical protein JW912_03180 [Sedimentisphaerales bacterium]|nr:hypothetical protein [Sedimentisphaerales bacterium]
MQEKYCLLGANINIFLFVRLKVASRAVKKGFCRMGGQVADSVHRGPLFVDYGRFRSKEDIAKGWKLAQNIGREIIINSRRLEPWIRVKIEMIW